MNKKRKQSNTILFSSFLIAVLMCFNIFYAYNQIQSLRQAKLETGWNKILSILTENQEKAQTNSDLVKANVVKDIGIMYGENKTGLRYDMDYLDVNNGFLKVLNNNVTGKFINIDNDNNDLFVLSTWQQIEAIALKGMVITDKSVNCMGDGKPRYFNSELEKHYNYNLGYDALSRVLTQNKTEPIFWEYLTNENPNHRKLQTCSLEGLKEVYMSEGVDGLKAYEFLKPAYINDNSDIFGIEKVNNLGSYNKDNRQIIVVQGFSLYDELVRNHMTQILLDNKTYDNLIMKAELLGVCGFLLTLVILVSITKVQNLSAELEELGDDNTRQTKE